MEPDTQPIITQADLDMLAEFKLREKSQNIFVVVDAATKSRLLKDPGLARVFVTLNRRIADNVASEANGIVITLAEALSKGLFRGSI